MRRAGAHGQDGFALIEAIAVMLLSGLVMLTLLIATDLVTRNSSAATRRANAIEGLSTGFAALRRDLAGASFTRGGDAADAPVLFTGGPRTLSLARSGDGPGSPPGSFVRIESRYEQGRGLLVRTEAPSDLRSAGFAGAAFGNPVVLLSGPWTYRLSYGKAAAGQIGWQENWANAKTLPDVVRLEILAASSGQPVLPPLLAPLRVDAEIVCVLGESGGCEGNGAEEQNDPDEDVQVDEAGEGEGNDDTNAGQ